MAKIYIVMYHYTRELKNSRYPRIRGLEVELFRKQIAFIKDQFSAVTMEQVMAAAKGKFDLPKKALLLTFDDGYIDHYTYSFPILEEYGVQGAFFIPGKVLATHKLLDVNKIHYVLACANPMELVKNVEEQMDYYRGGKYDYPPAGELYDRYAIANRFDPKEIIFVKRMLQNVLPEEVRGEIASNLFKKYVDIPETTLAYGLYMTPDQVRTLKRHGMYIGVHGYDHYWLGKLPQRQMMQDIDKALEVMKEYIEPESWAMNYPYGSYSDDVIEYVKKRGACVGFSTELGVADLDINNVLTLPRLDCNDFPPKSEQYKEW